MMWPTMTTHLDVKTEFVMHKGEEYEVVCYEYSVKLTGSGIVLYKKRYVDARDLAVAPVSIQYELLFDAVVPGDKQAEEMFNRSVSRYLSKIFTG